MLNIRWSAWKISNKSLASFGIVFILNAGAEFVARMPSLIMLLHSDLGRFRWKFETIQVLPRAGGRPGRTNEVWSPGFSSRSPSHRTVVGWAQGEGKGWSRSGNSLMNSSTNNDYAPVHGCVVRASGQTEHYDFTQSFELWTLLFSSPLHDFQRH